MECARCRIPMILEEILGKGAPKGTWRVRYECSICHSRAFTLEKEGVKECLKEQQLVSENT